MEPGDQRPEVRAHAGHRRGRQDHAARHVLPDERQLLVRRLLQGRRDRVRLGAGHRLAGRRLLRVRPRQGLGHRLRGRRRGRQALAQGRRAPRAPHPAPRQEGQLLAHRAAGAGRAVLGDLHRPRCAVRPRGRPGGRRGPVPGDLEPGLHAVRDRGREVQGGLPDRRRPAIEEHRHRDGPGAHRVPAPGGGQPLRDRRGLPGDHGGAGGLRQAVRRGPRRRRADARGRGPRALRADAHRRRRDPVERGARVRAAPPAAPLGAGDAPAGRRRADPAGPASGLARRDGGVLPRAGRRLRPDRPDRLRRGGGVPPHPGRRAPPSWTPRSRPPRTPATRCSAASRRSPCTTPTASRST